MPDQLTVLRAALAASALAALIATPAAAEVPCDARPPLEALNGSYEVSVGNALMTDGARVVPLRAQHSFDATMEAQGELLMMEADGSTVVFEYADPEDEALNYQELDRLLNISVSDFPALFGCSLDRLPALRGGGLSESQEGTPIEFEYELVVWNIATDGSAEMFGVLRWGGGGITTARAVLVSPST